MSRNIQYANHAEQRNRMVIVLSHLRDSAGEENTVQDMAGWTGVDADVLWGLMMRQTKAGHVVSVPCKNNKGHFSYHLTGLGRDFLAGGCKRKGAARPESVKRRIRSSHPAIHADVCNPWVADCSRALAWRVGL